LIEVTYRGQLGNRIFQYCLGRIIAERLGFCLKVEGLPQFPNTFELVNGRDGSTENTEILRGHRLDLPAILGDTTLRKIHLRGFFQRYEYFRDHKSDIKEWLRQKQGNKHPQVLPGDLAISLRRGSDYQWHKWCTPFSFFEQALQSASFKRLLVLTNAPKDPYLERFARYSPVLISGSQMDDFQVLMSCEKLILSESTFGWWAAFLSEAKEIHFPKTQHGLWSPKHPEIDLFVDDESRYILHEVSTLDVPTFPELVHREKIFVRRRFYHVLREIRKMWVGSDEDF
jgi:hypothetical protein